MFNNQRSIIIAALAAVIGVGAFFMSVGGDGVSTTPKTAEAGGGEDRYKGIQWPVAVGSWNTGTESDD
jgi:hypothetical protein